MSQPSTTSPNGPGETVEQKVRRLIAAGNCRQAVETAKEHNKRARTPGSEQLLLDAYVARIGQQLSRGSVQDARTMMAVVRERFPAHRDRLMPLEVQALAAEGKIDALVAPLLQPNLPQATRDAIENAVRVNVFDLSRLVGCNAIPPAHSFRAAAQATWRAFVAATSGPVTDEQIALPEISRRSPFAPWKLLIRAIALYYRNDDEGCRRALEAVPRDAAIRPLANLLTATLDNTPAAPGAAAAELRAKINASDGPLRDLVQRLEQRLSSGGPHASLANQIREVIALAQTTHPQQVERLRQHISVRCAIAGVPVQVVLKGIGASRKDAYYWRLLARGMELLMMASQAAAYWDRFLAHAEREGLFARNSAEAGMIHARMAGLLARLPAADLARARTTRLGPGRILPEMYRDQPPEIAALAPKDDYEVYRHALDPEFQFQRAAELAPSSGLYNSWVSWGHDAKLPARKLEEIAGRWRQAFPRDPVAPLLLASISEERNALKSALKHLAEAEALDAMNPAARAMRLRLTIATAWRHLRDRKPHLLDADLAELAKMPAMNEGDRPAFLEALRVARHVVAGDGAAAQQAYEAIVARAGPLLAICLSLSVRSQMHASNRAGWPKFDVPKTPEPVAAAETEARIQTLANELELPALRPDTWVKQVDKALSQRPCRVSVSDLVTIGRGAVERQSWKEAYLASVAGLEAAGAPAANARFLLIRAQALRGISDDRVSQCLRAAVDLARQANDAKLIAEISDATADDPYLRESLAAGRALGDELLAAVLKREREARTYVRDGYVADRYVVALPDRPARTFDDPFGWGDDDDDDDDYDDDDDLPFDPFEVFGGGGGTKSGGRAGQGASGVPRNFDPEVLQQALEELLGRMGSAGPPPPRRKRKR